MEPIKIGNRYIGTDYPVYIIAEIGSNFDGDLNQAKELIDLAKNCGADAVKFQSFIAEQIICKEAFKEKSSFQAKWDRPIYDVYKRAEFPRDWHKTISDYCKKQEMDFFSAPYDFKAVDILDEIGVPVFKIGSGDITYLALVKYIAQKMKPIILGTGASTIGEIEEAVNVIRSTGNNDIILLQCITNYPSHFECANIRAMVTIGNTFQTLVGYSDHTPGSIVPLGAVALGGCVIEKHFTLDKTLPGPDHPFAMDIGDFKKMVLDIRTMEKSLGTPIKNITDDENETVVLQRRSLYSDVDIKSGTVIEEDMLIELRPVKGILPKYKELILGRRTRTDIPKGEPITWDKI